MKPTLGLRLVLGFCLVSGMAACDDDEPSPGDAAVDARSDAGDAAADAPRVDAPRPDATDVPLDSAGDRPVDIGVDGSAGDAVDGGDARVDGVDGGTDGAVLTAQQQRGQYLVDVLIGCKDCHTPRLPNGQLDMSRYMAGDKTPAPGCLFKAPNNDCLYPRNLTNDATGLRNRTDAEIKKMFMEGKRPAPTGEEALHPVMPYYVFGNMAMEDADAIVAYLRTIPAVANEIPRRGNFWDVPAAAPPITLAKIPAPVSTYPNQAEALRGKYLATQSGLCIECHSPHRRGAGAALDEDKLFQGGEDFSGILGPTFPFMIVSSNITPDPTTGVGNYTLTQLVNAMKMGVDEMGKGICPPMPSGMGGYGGLTERDATDIAHYLKSIPPVVNAVVDMCVFPPPAP
jgi:hypothetical protein